MSLRLFLFITEFEHFSDGVFWVEQNIVTGKRELYRHKYAPRDNGKSERWAEGYSVQNAGEKFWSASSKNSFKVFLIVNSLFTLSH